MDRVVVVGAGLAGLQTVVALREQGYAGRLTLLGEESRLPYDRPPLSKGVLLGGDEDPTLPAHWPALDVELLLGCRATGLRPDAVETVAGELPYDGLVIATGGRARSLPGRGVRTLRTLDDALALRGALVPGARVVVVGAGWIGAEVATAAARAGCAVTALEAGPAPLSALPAEVGRVTAPWWVQAGVDLRTGTGVAAVEPGAVHLADGTAVPADLVVAGIGVSPATGWLAGSPVPLVPGGAVAVDAGLRTGVPGVLAVGDAAAYVSSRYGTRLHVEHWDAALRGPAVAAANLLGADATYDPVPYFWSDQFGRTLQLAGSPPAGERLVWRGDPARADGWGAFWLAGEALVAALAVDRPRDLVQARRLLERGAAVDPARLADPDVPVKASVAG